MKYLFEEKYLYCIFVLYYRILLPDEEIDVVSKELRKYGIQMPAFQKIGGLLTNNIATDTAVLHAAVIAVNQAVMEKVCVFYLIRQTNAIIDSTSITLFLGQRNNITSASV